jgi:DNA-directed RNA polymerase subunit K/omega
MKKEIEEEIEYTNYEKARILGARALQISANAPILLKISKEELADLNYDPIRIAELEFDEKVLPITVRRPLPRKMARELVETKEVEIVKEEKELPKESKEEAVPEEKAKAEEEEEKEAEVEEAKEEEVSEELEKATEEVEG